METKVRKVDVFKLESRKFKGKFVSINISNQEVFEEKDWQLCPSDLEKEIIRQLNSIIAEFISLSIEESRKFLIGFFVNQINLPIGVNGSIIFRNLDSFIFSDNGEKVFYKLSGHNDFFAINLPDHQKTFISEFFNRTRKFIYS